MVSSGSLNRQKQPGSVGVAAAEAIDSLEAVKELLVKALSVGEPMELFAGALSTVALNRHGEGWRAWVLDGSARGWSPQQVCTSAEPMA
jgi:hypothetical protein